MPIARTAERTCELSVCFHPDHTIRIGEEYATTGCTWQGRMPYANIDAKFYHPDCYDALIDHQEHGGSRPGSKPSKKCRICIVKMRGGKALSKKG